MPHETAPPSSANRWAGLHLHAGTERCRQPVPLVLDAARGALLAGVGLLPIAPTDALTGAANGRTFYECVTVEVGRARRLTRPLTLAYLDLDNFKQLNDRLGHAAGDQALMHFVQVVRQNLRNADVLARLGGDE